MNIHWDASCRPDPDFDPTYPSTGLCRSPAIQNFISNNISNIKSVTYFYTFNIQGASHVAITAKLFPVLYSNNHLNAFLWYSRNIQNSVNIPVNVVVDQNNNYRPCIIFNHTSSSLADLRYRQRASNRYIHFSWICNRVNRPIVMTQTGFINAMTMRNATLLNPNNAFTNFRQLQNSAIVIR